MIVCVCNNISDRKIRQAVEAGLSSMSELRAKLGVATSCGKCHSCAKNVLRECLEKNTENLLIPIIEFPNNVQTA